MRLLPIQQSGFGFVYDVAVDVAVADRAELVTWRRRYIARGIWGVFDLACGIQSSR